MSSIRSWLVAGLLAFPVGAHANLVSNGSFELPAQAPQTFTSFAPGGSIGAWSVVGPTAGRVVLIGSPFSEVGVTYLSQDGNNWLDLAGGPNQAVGVSQSIATVAAQTYQVSFFVGNMTAGFLGSPSSRVEVFADNASLGVFTNSTVSAQAIAWSPFSTSFTATGAATVLRFINGDPGSDNINGLDNIVVVETGGTAVIPVPAALPLLITGLGLVGLLGARRRIGQV